MYYFYFLTRDKISDTLILMQNFFKTFFIFWKTFMPINRTSKFPYPHSTLIFSYLYIHTSSVAKNGTKTNFKEKTINARNTYRLLKNCQFSFLKRITVI